jgi:glutamate racemase
LEKQMGRRLALLSTGVGVVDTVMSLVREQAPQLEVFNIVDDSIIRTISRNGSRVPALIARRITDYCRLAEENGADAVLVTCSSISETVDMARPLVSIPIFKIDEPMAEHAVAMARGSIGVVATLETTLQPTIRLIQSKIEASGKAIAIQPALAAGAFEALQEGKPEAHDQIVLAGIRQVLATCDVAVLAQASMARAAAALGAAEAARVLTSPRLGVAAAVARLAEKA